MARRTPTVEPARLLAGARDLERRGVLPEAAVMFEAAAEQGRATGDATTAVAALAGLARLAVDAGRYAEAASWIEEGRRLGDDPSTSRPVDPAAAAALQVEAGMLATELG